MQAFCQRGHPEAIVVGDERYALGQFVLKVQAARQVNGIGRSKGMPPQQGARQLTQFRRDFENPECLEIFAELFDGSIPVGDRDDTLSTEPRQC